LSLKETKTGNELQEVEKLKCFCKLAFSAESDISGEIRVEGRTESVAYVSGVSKNALAYYSMS
jgi:hypothetical protein